MISGRHIDRIILFLILAIVIAMGVILLLVGLRLNEGLWRNFLTQIGVALITAGILAMVTGWYLRERLFGEIADRVSDMLGEFRAEAIDAFHLQKLPHEILELIRKTVINQAVIQRNLTAHYQMRVVEIGGEPALRAEISSSSIYENLTADWQDSEIYEVGSALDDAFRGLPETQDSGFVSVRAAEAESGSINPPVAVDKVSMRLYVNDHEGAPIFRHAVRFSPNCRIKVTTLEINYFQLNDWENYPVTSPTITMEVSVSVVGDTFSLFVKPDDSLKYDFQPSVDPDGTVRGRITTALLPGQGMNLGWQPNGEVTSHGASADSASD